MKKQRMLIVLMGVCLLLAGCSGEGQTEKEKKTEKAESSQTVEAPEEAEEQTGETPDETKGTEPSDVQKEPQEPVAKGKLVVIDAGHQRRGNSEKEPVGPGASEKKAKVASGTSGTATGVNEYELTLQVSAALEKELRARGYTVNMVRTEHDVDISNAQRAKVANDSNADAFIRVHANGSENASVHGALTMCMTKKNPYNGNLYRQSRKLSEDILDEFCKSTGAKKCSIIETDTMSGINWCTVPVTIVEMGYMSNANEDKKLNDASYQEKIVAGMANGLDRYFGF